MIDAEALAPLLLLVGVLFAAGPWLDRASDRHRALVAGAVAFVGIRYLLWRLDATVLPYEGGQAAQAWAWFVFAMEVAAYLEVLVFLLIMSRGNDTAPLADRRQAEMEAAGAYPAVDVFIPTYNEGLDVLEKTIVGARALDYPNFTVWVLDDGRRDWLRDFCAAKGVRYLTRADNAHAKAGNLNNGLKHASGDFVAVFDADFVPAANFLRRTVGLFADPEIGIVQTPQHFFNKDPVQTNLLIAEDWPDEQRLFFDEMAASRDAWGVSFCCGSCSVLRRAALDAIDGVPTASITEDLLTTLAMLRRGYRTRYLNEKLSQGLAAESLEGFFVQRARWAQGGIQTIFLRQGPLGPGLSMLQRLLFFPSSWLVQYPVRMMVLVVPLVYLLLGVAPLRMDSAADLVAYQLPMFLAYWWGMRWFVGRKYVPVLSTAVGVFATFRLLPTVLAAVLRPFGKPFRVTPKGALNQHATDWFTFACIWAFVALSVLGLVVNVVPEWRVISQYEFFPVAAFWSSLNVVILVIASLICFDMPRHRREERFRVDEAVSVQAGAARFPARLLDLSLSGAGVLAQVPLEGAVAVEHGRIGTLPGRVVAMRGARAAVVFDDLPADVRDALIAELFSGRHATELPEAARSRRRLWRNLLRRALAATPG